MAIADATTPCHHTNHGGRLDLNHDEPCKRHVVSRRDPRFPFAAGKTWIAGTSLSKSGDDDNGVIPSGDASVPERLQRSTADAASYSAVDAPAPRPGGAKPLPLPLQRLSTTQLGCAQCAAAVFRKNSASRRARSRSLEITLAQSDFSALANCSSSRSACCLRSSACTSG